MPWNYETNRAEHRRGAVTIWEYERGLLYRDGRLVRVLSAGRYRLWAWRHETISVLDVRRATAQITNQKLLTSDQVTVGLNLSADYEVSDVALAAHAVANYQTQLHEDVQNAARQIVGGSTIDALLSERAPINVALLEAVRAAQSYGLNVLSVGIKDVILAPRVRDLLLKEVEAHRTAQAMLIGAREEVAALRALSNAAKLAADYPQLRRLRELETVKSFAQSGGNTVVWGVNGAIPLRANDAQFPAVASSELSSETE